MKEKHQCAEKVWDGTMHRVQYRLCSRNGTIQHGDKWYCGGHDPERRRLSEERKQREFDEKYVVYRKRSLLNAAAEEMLEIIELLRNEYGPHMPVFLCQRLASIIKKARGE